jgi:predicted anti-sigma-YlaC factor YlaD
MTTMWDCTEARLSLGVYVLGAIDPVERNLVDAHLETCQECRDELAGLAGLPALLARLDPDEVSRISADDHLHGMTEERPPADLIGTVLDLAKARRRREAWRYLSAAAAVVVLAAGLFGGLKAATSTTTKVPVPTGSEANWELARGTSQATGATATVAYSNELWGSAFDVLVDHIPMGTTCELWVVHPNGSSTQVAAWTTSRDEGRVWYAGSMPSTAGPISTFQITANHQVLLTVVPT